MTLSRKIHMNKTAKILVGVAALATVGVVVAIVISQSQAAITVTDDDDLYPCGKGYSLIGDICQPTPDGYVETRSKCEMGVDSMEAAGVEQDYLAELEKCRNAEMLEP